MNNRLFLLISTLITGLAGLYFFTQKDRVVRHDTQSPLDQTTSPTAPDITIKNFTFKEYEKNKAYAFIINAAEGRFFQAQDTILCNAISCTLLNNNDQVAHIKASNASIKQSTKDVFIHGLVQGNFKELTMQATDMHYNFSTNTITTEKPIYYQHPHASFSAQKSSINIKEYSIAMDGGVQSEFFIEPRDMQQPQ